MGVFETMLVLAGRPVELDAHLERLTASLAALYRVSLPTDARDTVIERASELEHGKLRITVRPTHGRAALKVVAGEIAAATVFPVFERGVALRSSTVDGGLGAHKWADRHLLKRLTGEAAAGELPLLLDADGTVLEASRGSVFALHDGRLITPPADGRILPSIARRQVVEAAMAAGVEVLETRLTLSDLRASGVFLAGSVRGVEPAHRLDGAELCPPGEISERVANGLRRRWRVPAREPVAAVAGGRRVGRPGH